MGRLGRPRGYQRLTFGQPSVNLGSTFGIFPSHLGPIFVDFAEFFDGNKNYENIHFRNALFSNKETKFSALWVVWGLLGGTGEKKRDNQMFLQDLHSFAPF